MSVKTIRGNLLFWKITTVFFILLTVLGGVYVMIASKLSKSYYTMANQQLYGNVAAHLASFTQPFKNGKPDTSVTHDIIHSTMVANPSVEVYLLDTAGKIVDYVVPDKSVKVQRVNMATVKKWLAVKSGERPLGDNPKAPDEPSIFSAAPVAENGKTVGYVYAVLSSEKQKEILNSLNSNLSFRLGKYLFFSALLIALLVGIITFFLITDSICQIAGVVYRFKTGDYAARIEGGAKGNLGVLTTAFNDMADVIVGNMDKIAATDKFRQELVANFSHDLRTPLSIMQGYIETLIMKKDQLTDDEKHKYLRFVYESNKKLSLLVEQLFEYAKLEANLITPNKEAFLIEELVSDLVAGYTLKAQEKGVTLTMHKVGSLSPVLADISLIENVLQNLIDNALKFTPQQGAITISLAPVPDGVQVQVADTGIGIAAEEQAYIFERYKQSHTHALSKQGMGIGLAIVKKILELHGSSISVHSEVNNGASFTFTVPKA